MLLRILTAVKAQVGFQSNQCSNGRVVMAGYQCKVNQYLQAGVLGIGRGGSIGSVHLDLEGVNVSLQRGLPSLQGGHSCQDLLQCLLLLGGWGWGRRGLQQVAAPPRLQKSPHTAHRQEWMLNNRPHIRAWWMPHQHYSTHGHNLCCTWNYA